MDTVIDNLPIEQEYFHRPSLNLRVKAMFVDMVIVISLMYLASLILNLLQIESGVTRGTILGLIFLYEPIAVAFGSTIGQSLMGLRVSQLDNLKTRNIKTNIGFGFSILRYITKILLGFISLLTVHTTVYGQALHDQASASVVSFR